MARAFRGGGPRRKTQWAGMGDAAGAANLPIPLNLTAGTPLIISQAGILGGAAGFVDEEVTLVRTIGMISAVLDTTSAGVVGSVAIGCGVMRLEALAIGVTALPSPEDDPDFEWLYYAVIPLSFGPSVSRGFGNAAGTSISFDVRGQRRVGRSETPVWIAESQNANAEVGVGGRYLVKLP